MAYSQSNFPGTSTDDLGGSFAWGNVTGVNQIGGLTASCGNNSNGAFADNNYIKSVGFGFSLPSNAVILGIEVRINRHASQNQSLPVREAMDSHLHLLKAGVEVGTDKADTVTIWTTLGAPPPGYTTITYGSPTDLWGTSWLPSDITNANFGMRFNPQAEDDSGSTTSTDIDWFQITVYYDQTIIVGNAPQPYMRADVLSY